jgi:Fe-S cluster assembly scaffold protein SufB
MIHIGKKLQIDHHFKGISAGQSQNSYRGLLKLVQPLKMLVIFAM